MTVSSVSITRVRAREMSSAPRRAENLLSLGGRKLFSVRIVDGTIFAPTEAIPRYERAGVRGYSASPVILLYASTSDPARALDFTADKTTRMTIPAENSS